MSVHRYTNPRRTEDGQDMFITACGKVLPRYNCVASDFKTTCIDCLNWIIKKREEELVLLKEKLPGNEPWRFRDLSK